jgi:hypothetical protein
MDMNPSAVLSGEVDRITGMVKVTVREKNRVKSKFGGDRLRQRSHQCVTVPARSGIDENGVPAFSQDPGIRPRQ